MKLHISFLAMLCLILSTGNVFAQDEITQSSPGKINRNLFSNSGFQPGPVIPGLKQDYIPQGLAYSKNSDEIYISIYSCNKKPSCLAVINRDDGKLAKVIKLKASNNNYLYGHVGGVALNDKNIFVTSEKNVYIYKRQEKPEIIPAKVFRSETSASFCAYFNNTLFVGEFVYGKKYASKMSHHVTDRMGVNKKALICAYDAKNPEEALYAISIRQKVQGISISDKYIFLSISYGRKSNSKIAVYKNPVINPAHGKIRLSDQKTVPLYFLDGKNHINTLDFPPMSEGITIVKNNLAILTESGARKYQKGGKGAVDYIIYYALSVLTEN